MTKLSHVERERIWAKYEGTKAEISPQKASSSVYVPQKATESHGVALPVPVPEPVPEPVPGEKLLPLGAQPPPGKLVASANAKRPPSGPQAVLPMIPESANPGRCAEIMLERLAVAAPEKTRRLAADAIRLHAAKLGVSPQKATLLIEGLAVKSQARGEPVNAFWFEDSKWKGAAVANPAAIGMHRPDAVVEPQPEPAAAPEGADTETGRRVWEGMAKAIKAAIGPKSFETWVSPFRQLGILDGVIYLEMPSDNFEHVPDRYELANYLPPTVGEIRFVMGKGRAA